MIWHPINVARGGGAISLAQVFQPGPGQHLPPGSTISEVKERLWLWSMMAPLI
jgi:hypothetical protein